MPKVEIPTGQGEEEKSVRAVDIYVLAQSSSAERKELFNSSDQETLDLMLEKVNKGLEDNPEDEILSGLKDEIERAISEKVEKSEE